MQACFLLSRGNSQLSFEVIFSTFPSIFNLFLHFTAWTMSGLRRSDLLKLDYLDLSRKLEESGLPEEAVCALKNKKIDGNTLAVLERDDVESEFRDEGIAVRVHIRALLHKLDNAENASLANNSDISQSIHYSTTRSTKTASIISSSGSQTGQLSISLVSGDSDANLSMESQSLESSATQVLNTMVARYSPENATSAADLIASKIPKDLPGNFRLPNQFGKVIDKHLQKNKSPGSIPKEMRSRVIRQVETTVGAYNDKPTPSTVEWIAKCLCEKYPCLQQVDPRSGMTDNQKNHADDGTEFKNWMLLKKQLLKRFENSRCQHKKLESNDDQASEPSKKKLKLSLKKGSSSHSDSEEEMEKHDAFLQKEMKKSKPNKEVVSKMMDKTLPMRRNFIKNLDAKCRVSETLKKYPCLQWQSEFQKEIIRILKIQGLSDEVAHIEQIKLNWHNQCKRLKAYGKYKCLLEESGTDSEVQENETQDFDGVDEYGIASVSDFQLLQVLPNMFKDGKAANGNFFIQEAGREDPCPQLKGRTAPYLLIYELNNEDKRQVFIMTADNCKYLELKNPVRAFDAVLCLLAMYYVYNFEYPNQVKGVFTFLQEYVLSDFTFNKNTTKYMQRVNEYLSFVNINF